MSSPVATALARPCRHCGGSLQRTSGKGSEIRATCTDCARALWYCDCCTVMVTASTEIPWIPVNRWVRRLLGSVPAHRCSECTVVLDRPLGRFATVPFLPKTPRRWLDPDNWPYDYPAPRTRFLGRLISPAK